MTLIRPFRALRPVPRKAADVACVPYDVVDTAEARALAEGNPASFLHVIRSEIDLPEGTGLYEEVVYEQAAENFRRFKDEAILIEETTRCLYLYQLVMGGHCQIGIAACCSLDEYEKGIIRRHEKTRKEKEEDRARHMLKISAHPGPVLMTYRGLEAIDSLVRHEAEKRALYDFVSADGIRHTIWRIEEVGAFVEVFKNVPFLYISDGHHRTASASRARQELLKKHPNSTGEEEFNFFLSVLFPADQLKILSYNRFIRDLNGMSETEFLKAVRERFDLQNNGRAEPSCKGHFGMYLNKRWYEFRVRNGMVDSSDPVSALDVSILQKHLLDPVLDIKDQQKDHRIDFVGGVHSKEKLERRVDRDGGVAFTFFPVSIEELLAVADAGQFMPTKSTWFEPKLRSGLLIHAF